MNQPRPALEPPDATPELCADFAKLAPLAAVIPKWCDANHPIGKAYQAACFVLDYALLKGRGHEWVPAAYRVRCAIEALLAKRDERLRLNNHDAKTVALLHALWVERCRLRDIAQKAGRHLKTIQERIERALDALTAEFGDALQHFDPAPYAYLNATPAPIDKKFKRPKPQLRTSTKTLAPSTPEEVERMVADYRARGGQAHQAPSGLTHDWMRAVAALHSGERSDKWEGAGFSIVVPKESGAGLPEARKPPRYERLPAMRARPLPKKIKDLSRLPGARGHASEVWVFLHGAGFSEPRAKEEEADEKKVHELVEQLLDPETRKRREEAESEDAESEGAKSGLTPEEREEEQRRELEKELLRGINDVPSDTKDKLDAGSVRSRRRRGLLAKAFLEGKKDEIRRLKIIERSRERIERDRERGHSPVVLEEVRRRRRLPSMPPEPIRLQDLERVKHEEVLKHHRRKGRNLPSRKKGESA